MSEHRPEIKTNPHSKLRDINKKKILKGCTKKKEALKGLINP